MTEDYQSYQNKNKVIVRKDIKGSFLAISTDSLVFNKLRFEFVEYDGKQEKGNKVKNKLTAYLDLNEALVFAESVLDGKLAKEVKEAFLKSEKTKNPWDKNVTISMGGNKSGWNGKPESRTLSVSQATGNYAVNLSAINSLGVLDEVKGIIKPAGGGERKQMSFPLTASDFREIAVLIKAHIQAYLTYQYMKEAWAFEMPKQQNNNGSNYNGSPNNYGNNNRSNGNANYSNSNNNYGNGNGNRGSGNNGYGNGNNNRSNNNNNYNNGNNNRGNSGNYNNGGNGNNNSSNQNARYDNKPPQRQGNQSYQNQDIAITDDDLPF